MVPIKHSNFKETTVCQRNVKPTKTRTDYFLPKLLNLGSIKTVLAHHANQNCAFMEHGIYEILKKAYSILLPLRLMHTIIARCCIESFTLPNYTKPGMCLAFEDLVFNLKMYALMTRILNYYFQRPDDLWAIHSQPVFPKPHKRNNSSWMTIEKVCHM